MATGHVGDAGALTELNPHREEALMPSTSIADITLARRLVFGGNVRRHRQELGMSQEELSIEAGVDRKTINRIEQGVHSVRLDNVWLIAEALNVDIRDLFND